MMFYFRLSQSNMLIELFIYFETRVTMLIEYILQVNNHCVACKITGSHRFRANVDIIVHLLVS